MMMLTRVQKKAGEDKISELEKLHSEIEWRDADLLRKQATIDIQRRDYQELLEAKVRLSSEIKNYQKLLEAEETR